MDGSAASGVPGAWAVAAPVVAALLLTLREMVRLASGDRAALAAQVLTVVAWPATVAGFAVLVISFVRLI